MVVDFPLVPVIPTTRCDGNAGRAWENSSIPDDWHPVLRCLLGDRLTVEGHAGRHDNGIIARQIRCQGIGNLGLVGDAIAQFFAIVPGEQLRPACVQAFEGRHAGPGQPQYGIALACKGGRDDHLSFNVASPASASTRLMIQKRITMVDSDQPSCSKW